MHIKDEADLDECFDCYRPSLLASTVTERMFLSSPNSHVDILNPNAMVAVGGALGHDCVMRMEPP